MPNWLIFCVSAIVLLYGMLHGLLMLVSPSRHRRFNLRISDPFGKRFTVGDSDDNRGLELGYRLAGFGILIMCTLMVLGSADSLLGHHHGEPLPRHVATPAFEFGKYWWDWIASAGFFLFGLYAFLRPSQLHWWSTARALPSSILPPEPNQVRKGGRILGICFMILGVISLLLTLNRIQH